MRREVGRNREKGNHSEDILCEKKKCFQLKEKVALSRFFTDWTTSLNDCLDLQRIRNMKIRVS